MLIKRMLFCFCAAALLLPGINANAMGPSLMFKGEKGLVNMIGSAHSDSDGKFYGCPMGDCSNIVIGEVFFAFDKSELNHFEKGVLDDVAKCIVDKYEDDRKVQITFLGHTDERGKAAYNDALAHRRAVAVEEYVFSRVSELVEDQTLFEEIKKASSVHSKGSTALVVLDSTTEEAHAKNRRVVVELNS